MQIIFNGYEISDEKSRLQLNEIHNLLKETYWSKDIPKVVIQNAVDNSLCFGIYKDKKQVGFARVVTDTSTFAWLCDVIIDEQHRGKYLSKELMKFILAHSSLQGLRRFCLATKDAHKLYEQFGFKVTESPQNWMEIKNNNIYLNQDS